MSTVAAPALETGGGSSSSGSSAGSAAPAAVDPIDSLDFTDVIGSSGRSDGPDPDIPLPESMIIGGKRSEPAEGVEEATVARDESGKFASPADKAKAKAVAKDGTTEGAEGVEGAEGTDSQAPVTSPWKYRAMGQTHDLDGATVNEKGDVTIPGAHEPMLRQAFNALHASGELRTILDRRTQELTTAQQQLKARDEQRSLADTKAEQLVNALTEAMTDPDDNRALERLWALRGAWPQLTAKAEAAYWQAEAQRGKAPAPKPAEAPTDRASAPTMPAPDAALATTRDYIEHLKIDRKFRDVAPDDWKQFEADVAATPLRFLRLATAQDAQQHPGVQEGQIVFDTDMVDTAVQSFASRRTTERETAAAQSRLAADHARRTQPTIDAPPTPGGGRSAGKPKRGAGITSKQAYDDWLNSDEI